MNRIAIAAAALVLAATTATAQVSYRLPARDASRVAVMADPGQATPMEMLIDAAAAPRASTRQAAPVAQSAGTPAIVPGSTGRPLRMTEREDFATYQALAEAAARASSAIAPQNFGINSANTIFHFNDYLAEATWAYPQRTVGRLLFTFNGSSYFTCTASIINNAILVTAGHCVYNQTDGWVQEATFYPAYDDSRGLSAQLFGRCNVTDVTITQQWFDENQITNGYDVALAVCGRIYDAAWAFYRNSVPGFRIGTLGFCYRDCAQPYMFLSQLGYPANYYGGGRMTVSQHLSTTVVATPVGTATTDFVAGSGMRGGSSGGPHISNIGEISDSSTDLGQLTMRNVVYAVTSWGYTSETHKIQGASPLSGPANANNFVEMFNQACRRARREHGSWVCSALPST